MAGILRVLFFGSLLLIPLPRIWKSEKRLSWASAVVMGVYFFAIGIVFIAEIPSRILYYVDSRSGEWVAAIPALKFVLSPKGAGQSLLADAIANTVGFIFFGIIVAGIWFWGEKQRKAGRFSRR